MNNSPSRLMDMAVKNELTRLDALGPRTSEEKAEDCKVVRSRRHDSFVSEVCARCQFGPCDLLNNGVYIVNSSLGVSKHPEPFESDGNHNVFEEMGARHDETPINRPRNEMYGKRTQ